MSRPFSPLPPAPPEAYEILAVGHSAIVRSVAEEEGEPGRLRALLSHIPLLVATEKDGRVGQQWEMNVLLVQPRLVRSGRQAAERFPTERAAVHITCNSQTRCVNYPTT